MSLSFAQYCVIHTSACAWAHACFPNHFTWTKTLQWTDAISQHLWKQPLTNVLIYTETPGLKALADRSPSAVTCQANKNTVLITRHPPDNLLPRWWKLFVATGWPWCLSHTPDRAGQNQFSPKVFTLLSAQRPCLSSLLPLARDRVDKGSNATSTVAMSHFHHGTITVIHNRNHVWC